MRKEWHTNKHSILWSMGKKECEALSPFELVYFSSSTTGHPGAGGFGVCRTLVLVALLCFSSPKTVLSSGRSLFGSLQSEICPCQITGNGAVMPVWEQYTTQHRHQALLFPQRVSVRAEERTTELQDQPQLPNICFLPLHVKSAGLVSLQTQRLLQPRSTNDCCSCS